MQGKTIIQGSGDVYPYILITVTMQTNKLAMQHHISHNIVFDFLCHMEDTEALINQS